MAPRLGPRAKPSELPKLSWPGSFGSWAAILQGSLAEAVSAVFLREVGRMVETHFSTPRRYERRDLLPLGIEVMNLVRRYEPYLWPNTLEFSIL